MKRWFALALVAGSLAMAAPASSTEALRVSVTNDYQWHGPATVIVSQTGLSMTMTVAPFTTSSITVPKLATTLHLKTSHCDTKLALPFKYLEHRTRLWVAIHDGCVLKEYL